MSPFLTTEQTNCKSGGGWWVKRCNQKGVLTATNQAQADYPGITWSGHRLSEVQMLIRPRAYIPPAKIIH